MRNYFGKNPSQKRAGGMAQGVGPEFKPQYHTQIMFGIRSHSELMLPLLCMMNTW
jgi:hypothetical protein